MNQRHPQFSPAAPALRPYVGSTIAKLLYPRGRARPPRERARENHLFYIYAISDICDLRTEAITHQPKHGLATSTSVRAFSFTPHPRCLRAASLQASLGGRCVRLELCLLSLPNFRSENLSCNWNLVQLARIFSELGESRCNT